VTVVLLFVQFLLCVMTVTCVVFIIYILTVVCFMNCNKYGQGCCGKGRVIGLIGLRTRNEFILSDKMQTK
jgi:hypothetical protein